MVLTAVRATANRGGGHAAVTREGTDSCDPHVKCQVPQRSRRTDDRAPGGPCTDLDGPESRSFAFAAGRRMRIQNWRASFSENRATMKGTASGYREARVSVSVLAPAALDRISSLRLHRSVASHTEVQVPNATAAPKDVREISPGSFLGTD